VCFPLLLEFGGDRLKKIDDPFCNSVHRSPRFLAMSVGAFHPLDRQAAVLSVASSIGQTTATQTYHILSAVMAYLRCSYFSRYYGANATSNLTDLPHLSNKRI